jgi:hypothetical protein
MKENIYDVTKDIINIIDSYNIKPLNEEDNGDMVSLTDDELKSEEDLIKQTVSNRIEVKSVNVYKSDRNVLLLGEMTDMNIGFQMSLNDSEGLSIYPKEENEKIITLNQNSLRNLQKLVGYYENWKDTWFNEKLDLIFGNEANNNQ